MTAFSKLAFCDLSGRFLGDKFRKWYEWSPVLGTDLLEDSLLALVTRRPPDRTASDGQ